MPWATRSPPRRAFSATAGGRALAESDRDLQPARPFRPVSSDESPGGRSRPNSPSSICSASNTAVLPPARNPAAATATAKDRCRLPRRDPAGTVGDRKFSAVPRRAARSALRTKRGPQPVLQRKPLSPRTTPASGFTNSHCPEIDANEPERVRHAAAPGLTDARTYRVGRLAANKCVPVLIEAVP